MERKPSAYLVRTYRSGDEVDAARLFNEAFSKYAGFVPRTPEYWVWCYKKRPSVGDDGICIIEKSTVIVGYTVVALESVRGKALANVLDLCYRHDEGLTVVRSLVEWVNEYGEKKKVDAISFDAPSDDELLRKVVKENGFTESLHAIPLIMINDFAGLIEKIATSRSISSKRKQVFHVRLRDATTVPDNTITIEVKDGKIKATPGEDGIATAKVTTSVATLTSCLFGNTNATKAILGREIKVRPFWKLVEVAKLLSAMQLIDPWFIPAGDFG